jgi:hypothetical protein
MEDFNADLVHAFPKGYPPGLQIISHGCDECDQLQVDFVGREWDTITPEAIERHYTDLPLLTSDAFRYFLPAFLRAAAANSSSSVAEFLMYSLAPSGLRDSEVSEFSPLQRSLVVRFLDLLAARGQYIQDKVWTKTRVRWQPA